MLMCTASREVVAVVIASAAAVALHALGRRRNTIERRVETLMQRQEELAKEKKRATNAVAKLTRWVCDVKGEGCCAPSLTIWSQTGSVTCDRHTCTSSSEGASKCNWDVCSNCLPLAQHKCLRCSNSLRCIPHDPDREQKRLAAIERKYQVVWAFRANEAALAAASRALELRRTAERARAHLEAATRAATAAECALKDQSQAASSAAPALRTVIQLAYDASHASRAVLESAVDFGPSSSRKGFLRALTELIPRPVDHAAGGLGGEWRAEWIALTGEWAALTEQSHMKTWLRHVSDIDNCTTTHAEQVEACVSAGWPREHAIAVWLLQSRIRALARALRERDACYAHSLYTLTAALVSAASRQPVAAQRLYANLTGKFGLTLNDDSWHRLEVPDRFGFRGLSSVALVKATCGPSSFGINAGVSGFAVRVTRTRPEKRVDYEVQDSPVVCFESSPPSADSLHSAIMVGEHEGFFPPNTLFRLKAIGAWAQRAHAHTMLHAVCMPGMYTTVTTAHYPSVLLASRSQRRALWRRMASPSTRRSTL